ncbi:MAG: phosphoglycolate phosphatase [bacterium P3]|nr:MAG: phosphoglycolate phosphatase [bacterium P3]KWW40748.1 MAG: phosphoglycolate phosphatase [bacterium F083]
MKHYDLIVFDLDGTLADTSTGIYNAIRYTQAKMGLYPPETEEQMRSHIGPPVEESYHRIFGLTDDRLAQAVALHKEYSLRQGLYEASLYDGMETLLPMLKTRFRLAVATLKFEETAIEMLSRLKVAACFTTICGATPGIPESKKQILERCLSVCRCRKESALLIGDSLYDAIGAEQAGIDFVGVTYGFGFASRDDADSFRNEGCADDVEQLKKILL